MPPKFSPGTGVLRFSAVLWYGEGDEALLPPSSESSRLLLSGFSKVEAAGLAFGSPLETPTKCDQN